MSEMLMAQLWIKSAKADELLVAVTKQTPSGIPWILPDGEVSGVLMSA